MYGRNPEGLAGLGVGLRKSKEDIRFNPANVEGGKPKAVIMNEARLSHLPFWGPSEGFFLIDSTAVGLTRMKRSPRLTQGFTRTFNPKLERFIRVNPTAVESIRKKPSLGPQNGKWLKRASFIEGGEMSKCAA